MGNGREWVWNGFGMDFRGSDFYRSRLAKVGFVWEMRAKLRHFLNFQVELRSFARKVFAAEKQMIESQKLGKGNCPKWPEQVGKNAAPQQLKSLRRRGGRVVFSKR